MRRTEAKSVTEIIAETFGQGDNSERFDLQRASLAWTEVMGSEVNRQTFRRYIEGSKLHVHIVSASLKNELLYQKDNIIRNINRTVGRDVLTDIIIH